MKKSYAQIILLIAVLIIAVGFLFIQNKWGKTPIAGPADPAQSQPAVTSFATLDVSKIQTTKTKDNSDPGYSISLEYPINIVGSDYIKSQIDGDLTFFKTENDVSTMTPDEIKNYGPSAEHQYSFITMYKAYHNANYLTHRIDTYTFSGGAHGGTVVVTYTYNTKGDLVALPNLFLNNTTAVKAFSDKITAILKTPPYKDRINTEVFSGGAGPDLNNFSAFAFDGSNLRVIFQQYQVGPYSSGIIEVPIPLAELQGILKPEYLSY
jgi:hypothetical protein